MSTRPAPCALLVAVVALVLVGCQPAAPSQPGTAEGGGMGAPVEGEGGGMGGGSDPMSGLLADASEATIGPDAPAMARGVVVVARVLAPEDGWLVVRSAVEPGVVFGYVPVRAGENRDVRVRIQRADSPLARVALHGDRGSRGVFEFDPTSPALPLDKPVMITGGGPVEAPMVLTGFGVAVTPNHVLIDVDEQASVRDKIVIRYLLLNEPTWISVNVVENGLPGRRVGLVMRQAGESREIGIPVKGLGDADALVTTAIADRGERGRFEYRLDDPFGSPDQPYVSAGVVVSHTTSLTDAP